MKFNIFRLYRDNYKLIKSNTKNRFLENVYKEWDSVGNIPLELGKYLENLIVNQEKEKYYIGVHRSSSFIQDDIEKDITLKSIFNDGLINNGGTPLGINTDSSYPDIEKTVLSTDNMLKLVIALKSSYKGSKGSILLKIPSDYVDEELNIKDNMGEYLYDIKDGVYYIKPEFILGYVSCDENKNCKWYPKELFIEKRK